MGGYHLKWLFDHRVKPSHYKEVIYIFNLPQTIRLDLGILFFNTPVELDQRPLASKYAREGRIPFKNGCSTSTSSYIFIWLPLGMSHRTIALDVFVVV